MKLFFCSTLLLIFLTGCPYKKVYTVIPESVSEVNSFKIIPVSLFYKESRDIVKCDVVYKIKNETNSMQEFNFSASQLIGQDTSIKVSDITWMGNVPIINKIRIYPASDTLIGLGYIGSKNHFGDTIKVVLASPDLIYRTFFYTRKKKK